MRHRNFGREFLDSLAHLPEIWKHPTAERSNRVRHATKPASPALQRTWTCAESCRGGHMRGKSLIHHLLSRFVSRALRTTSDVSPQASAPHVGPRCQQGAHGLAPLRLAPSRDTILETNGTRAFVPLFEECVANEPPLLRHESLVLSRDTAYGLHALGPSPRSGPPKILRPASAIVRTGASSAPASYVRWRARRQRMRGLQDTTSKGQTDRLSNCGMPREDQSLRRTWWAARALARFGIS